MIINDAGDLLEAAAHELENQGWIREQLYDEVSGRLCILGALRQFDVHERYHEIGCKAIHQIIGPMHIADWNDDVCESQEAAVEMLRVAAKHVRENNGVL